MRLKVPAQSKVVCTHYGLGAADENSTFEDCDGFSAVAGSNSLRWGVSVVFVGCQKCCQKVSRPDYHQMNRVCVSGYPKELKTKTSVYNSGIIPSNRIQVDLEHPETRPELLRRVSSHCEYGILGVRYMCGL